MSRPSPAKPWETRRSTSTNSSSTSTMYNSGTNSMNYSTNSSSTPYSSSTTNNFGNYSTTYAGESTPRLPPRPNVSSYGGYGGYDRFSNYGSGYGGYSSYDRYGSGYGYGNRYGGGYGGYGYGSSYGGYGSRYGGYGGYSGYGGGMYGNRHGGYGPPGREGREGGWLDSSYNRLRDFGDVVEGFSRFSSLLDANFDAMHGSFSSILRLLDVFSEFTYVIRSFAVFRLLFGGFSYVWRLFNRMIGREIESTPQRRRIQDLNSVGDMSKFDTRNPDVAAFEREQKNRRVFPAMLVLLGLGFMTLPILILKISSIIRRKANELEMDDAWDGPSRIKVKTLYNFPGEDPQDLQFKRNETIFVIAKPFPDWWEGESLDGKRRGLFPANFVREINHDGSFVENPEEPEKQQG